MSTADSPRVDPPRPVPRGPSRTHFRPAGRSPGPLPLPLLLALVAPACAGQCPTPTSDPVSVTPMRAPCVGASTEGAGPASDPLTLLGGQGFLFARVDVAAIRRSPYGGLMERAVDAFFRAEVRGPEAATLRDGLARTDVVAFSLNVEGGVTVVAQGRYTEADLEVLELSERRPRRQHMVHHDRRNSAVVAAGRYLVVAERVGVEPVLDRLDALEDPDPMSGPLLSAAREMSAYGSYFSMVGIPRGELRREFEREEGLRGVHADLRWAGFSVVAGSAGIEVRGRVHAITESAARAVVAKSEEVRGEAVAGLSREVPELADAARALSFGVSGTDATLTWNPTDAQSRTVIEAVTNAFERDAQRRASYATPAAVTAPVP